MVIVRVTGNGSDYQFVVIGKTGNGKSATCNTILGRKQFAIGRGVSTTTVQVQVEEGTRMGCRLKDRDIRVEMRNAGQELKKVLEDAKNRYIVFDNKVICYADFKY
nr:hypothetical protein BaRGS_002323 [Batillaria attramentaria]